MKERIITALCLIVIVVPAVIFGGIFYKIVIGVAMALSVYEMLHICSRPRIGMYMYIIVDNIRDVIPYPRTPGNCEY